MDSITGFYVIKSRTKDFKHHATDFILDEVSFNEMIYERKNKKGHKVIILHTKHSFMEHVDEIDDYFKNNCTVKYYLSMWFRDVDGHQVDLIFPRMTPHNNFSKVAKFIEVDKGNEKVKKLYFTLLKNKHRKHKTFLINRQNNDFMRFLSSDLK